MIQPISQSMTPGNFSNPISDEVAFRMWMTRRDAARQQIRRLSRRELQVVQLVSNGLANKSIALELQISVKTIEKHRANAARKLGVASTAEMVRMAVLADHEAQERNRLSHTMNSTPQNPMPQNASTHYSTAMESVSMEN